MENQEESLRGNEQPRTADIIKELKNRGINVTFNNTATEEPSSISIVRMDEVEEEELKWLYCPYIPRGKVTLCSAHPGSGKTWVMCYAVSCVSVGKQFFDICPFDSMPENAIYITAEDGLGDTIKKRLRACGADMTKVYSIRDPKAEMTFNNPKLEEIIKEVNPALLVMDPMQAYIGENVEMNAANKTRPMLTHLVSLAEKYNVAIVLVCHYNKNNKGESITRVIGSMDIVGVGRSCISIGNVPNEDKQKYMSHEKSSNAERGKTKLFHIDPDNGGIVLDGESNLLMSDYTALQYDKHRKDSDIAAAKMFLLDQIPEGKRLQSELVNLGKANGFSYDALNRARNELKIVSKKEGFGGAVYWIKPEQPSDT